MVIAIKLDFRKNKKKYINLVVYNFEFKKSIINIHDYYQTNNQSNDDFIKMIDKCFDIKRTTFYNWTKDDNVINCNIIYENNNKLISLPIETFIINLINDNKNIGIKNIKKKIKDNFKITINNKSISYILHKNNIKHKNIKSIDVYEENKNNKNIILNLLFLMKNKQILF